MAPTRVVAVCWKWVDHRPDIDPLTGAVTSGDPRFGGISEADAAALEIGLRIAQTWGARVRVVTVGSPDADKALRQALACGAHEVHRVALETAADSSVIAAALANHLRDVTMICCGDYSIDRGSGSVPAFLAAHLNVASALGAVSVEALAAEAEHPLRVVRRLDAGRREVLAVPIPAVVSVEGSVATLRRASLAATLQAEQAVISTSPGPVVIESPHRHQRPYRPRARALAAPEGTTALDRVRQLTGSAGSSSSNRTEVLELAPMDAAQRLLDMVTSWSASGDTA
jgi:electron transfer flavoprotein beta subunit